MNRQYGMEMYTMKIFSKCKEVISKIYYHNKLRCPQCGHGVLEDVHEFTANVSSIRFVKCNNKKCNYETYLPN